jgi:hypothetical protein
LNRPTSFVLRAQNVVAIVISSQGEKSFPPVCVKRKISRSALEMTPWAIRGATESRCGEDEAAGISVSNLLMFKRT